MLSSSTPNKCSDGWNKNVSYLIPSSKFPKVYSEQDRAQALILVTLTTTLRVKSKCHSIHRELQRQTAPSHAHLSNTPRIKSLWDSSIFAMKPQCSFNIYPIGKLSIIETHLCLLASNTQKYTSSTPFFFSVCSHLALGKGQSSLSERRWCFTASFFVFRAAKTLIAPVLKRKCCEGVLT